jgi:hypothetical protein
VRWKVHYSVVDSDSLGESIYTEIDVSSLTDQQKQSIHDAIMWVWSRWCVNWFYLRRPNHVRYTLVPDIKALNAIAFLWDCHDGEDITNPFCPMCKCDKERIGEFKCQEEWGQRTLRFRHWELTCDIMVCALHAKQRYVEGLLRYILTTFPQTSETFVENMRKISGGTCHLRRHF